MTHLKHYLSASDWQTLTNTILARANNKLSRNSLMRRSLVVSVIPGLLAFFIVKYVIVSLETGARWLLITTCALYFISLIWGGWWRKRDGLAKWMAEWGGTYEWCMSDEGVSIHREEKRSFYPWSSFVALEEDADYWFLYLRKTYAVVIPKAAEVLAGDADIAAQIKQYWQAHPNNLYDKLDGQLPHPLSALLTGLVINLKQGARLAFMRSTSYGAFKVSLAQILSLGVLQILLYMASDYWLAPAKPLFNSYAIMQYGVNFGLLILAAIFVVHIPRKPFV